MKKFRVQVAKEWTEHGEVEVDAADNEAAREMVAEMLSDGSDDIQWHGHNMDPGDQRVECVTELRDPLKNPQTGDTIEIDVGFPYLVVLRTINRVKVHFYSDEKPEWWSIRKWARYFKGKKCKVTAYAPTKEKKVKP